MVLDHAKESSKLGRVLSAWRLLDGFHFLVSWGDSAEMMQPL